MPQKGVINHIDAGAETDIRASGEKLRSGYEMRSVECSVEYDLKKGIVGVFRTDTGELVETRPMTDTERQEDLPLQ